MFMGGVNRLSRGHLAEIFASKSLPSFQRLDWIADDRVILVFSSAEDASAALAGCGSGFDDAAVKGEEKPGPGLWRAQRGMLEIRQATVADHPDLESKRQHRGGRQVREYRFWEAIKDVDRSILDTKGTKRPAPSGEDALAAAIPWDEIAEEAPARKRRRMAFGDDDEEAPSLLEQMSQLDRQILAKKEGAKEEVYDTPLAPTAWQETVEKWGRDGYADEAEDDTEQSWGHHAKEEGRRNSRWQRNSNSWWQPATPQAWDGDEASASSAGRKRRHDRVAASTSPPRSAEEQAKRQRRLERFRTDAPPIAVATAGAG